MVTHGEARTEGAGTALSAGERAYRWSHEGALKLWVQPSSALTGFTPRHLELVDEAVYSWMHSGGTRIVQVSWAIEADIRLYWSDRLPSTNPGVTMLYRNQSGRLTRADIFVAVQPAPWAIGTPDRVLYTTIAHEIGHALGLPHDPSANALMHPAPLVTTVTDEDIARLNSIVRGP